MIFRKRCAPRFHAECTGHCVESFHEEPIREKNVIFKKVASWYPGIPVRGSASSLFSRFAGSHPFTGSPIRFASVFPVPGSDPVQSHAAISDSFSHFGIHFFEHFLGRSDLATRLQPVYFCMWVLGFSQLGFSCEEHDFQKKVRAAIACRIHRSLRRELSRGAHS